MPRSWSPGPVRFLPGRPSRLLLTLLTLILACSVPVCAEDIFVPADYPTIQGAIISSTDGDTIHVAPGTYIENITFGGLAITVRSTDGPDVTVIDGGQFGSVASFVSGETTDAVLDGFTLTNGNGNDAGNGLRYGGGVECQSSSPTITNCHVVGNSAANLVGAGLFVRLSSPIIDHCFIADNVSFEGGGIVVVGASPDISDNIIQNNTVVSGGGGGIESVLDSTPVIGRNLIVGNYAEGGGGGLLFLDILEPLGESQIFDNEIVDNSTGVQFYGDEFQGSGGGILSTRVNLNMWNNRFHRNFARRGGGAAFHDPAEVFSTNDIYYGNTAEQSAGGILCAGADPVIVNGIIWGNQAPSDPQIDLLDSAVPSVTFSDVQDGWPGAGNIDESPEFVDPDGGDFHLEPTSPCIDAGSEAAVQLPFFDFEGDPRVVGDTVDMGVDEVTCFSGSCNEFIRGDADASGVVNLIDGVVLLNFLFVAGSPAPACMDAADVDDSGTLQLPDGIYVLNHLFLPGSSEPPAPFPFCGPDSTQDLLECADTSACP